LFPDRRTIKTASSPFSVAKHGNRTNHRFDEKLRLITVFNRSGSTSMKAVAYSETRIDQKVIGIQPFGPPFVSTPAN
jgi:hypothetical protein